MITQERLKQQLHYDEESGLFTYTSNRGKCHKGARAGTWHEYGYRQIQLDGKIYKEHRLAWLYVYGYMPEEIDHINGQRDCNPIANLRKVSRSQNNANAERPVGQAGLRGVTWFERDQKWKAQIKVSSQTVHLGYYDTAEAAHEAYLVAADITYGEHAYHNRP